MPKHDQSDSESEEPREKSSSEEEELKETNNGSNNHEVSEYEKQRLSRIRENKARMEAMGLRNMAFKMMGSVEKQKKMKKGKGKEKAVEDDEEYNPCKGVDDLSSESDEDGGDGDGDDDYEDEFVGGKGKGSGSRRRKVKSNKNSKSKKKASVKKLPRALDFIGDDDDDEELMQAIALSLKDSGVSNTVVDRPSQSGGVKTVDATHNERKGNAHIQEDTGRRKRKKQVTSRVQMTEDELIMHFFQFDEAGKGNINLRDLQRVSNTHDFVWTDREMADMIFCFDSDGDGKLSLDDFWGIVSRCNMIKGSENGLPVSKS